MPAGGRAAAALAVASSEVMLADVRAVAFFALVPLLIVRALVADRRHLCWGACCARRPACGGGQGGWAIVAREGVHAWPRALRRRLMRCTTLLPHPLPCSTPFFHTPHSITLLPCARQSPKSRARPLLQLETSPKPFLFFFQRFLSYLYA
jgi:hypothetical protein